MIISKTVSCVVLCGCLFASSISAGTVGGVTVNPAGSVSGKSRPAVIDPDRYSVELASITAVPADKVQTLFENGFGRREMAAVIVISKHSGSSLDEIASERGKLATLRKICEDRGLSYEEIIAESENIKEEIESLIYSAGYGLNHSSEPENTPDPVYLENTGD